MDPFSLLTAGVSFRRSKHQKEIDRFGLKTRQSLSSLISTSAVNAAVRPGSLDLFSSSTHPSASRPPSDPAASGDRKRPLLGNVFGQSRDSGSEEPSDSDDRDPGTESECENGIGETFPSRDRAQDAIVREDHKIKVSGLAIPSPVLSFSDIALEHQLVLPSFPTLKPIQMQSIPILLSRRDLFACAPTGSGKTLSYLIPILSLRERAVVVVPTRELSLQIQRVAQTLLPEFTQYLWTGTPNHLLADKTVPWKDVAFAVFDEADRLWSDDDFLVSVDEIISRIPADSTRALFSATLPEKIEELARSVMSVPVRVMIGFRNAPAEQIEQRLLFAGSEEGKVLAIRQLFVDGGLPLPVLIFVQSVERAEELYKELGTSVPQLKIDRIHAKRALHDRDRIVQQFRSGQLWALICSDLMARGVDFKAVGAVINYDFPQTVLSYIHRIGRTGRGDRKGIAITLFTEQDAAYLRAIVSVMRQAGCAVPEWMLKLKKPSRSKRRNWEEAPVKRQGILEAAGKGSMHRDNKRRRKTTHVNNNNSTSRNHIHRPDS